MAARIDGIFDKDTQDKIKNCKLLVVGAGGIGCELLKVLVLTGFENIHVIDLDTIDLSNLNRQFLFHKQHIGKPKATVAKESVLRFNEKAKIVAYHDSITNLEYNVEFYRQFTAVANALDNVAARSHVNRMCMAAEIPLIESGSAGYLGQTTVYKRRETECFECLPRKPQKTYPGCTIRNTPSEPVHCIVWAKHLFNQLFGESDADDEVSPDVSESQLSAINNVDYLQSDDSEAEQAAREKFSTRVWAMSTRYDPQKLFNKLFNEDILYLIKMSDLWEKRRAPIPLKFENLADAVPGSSQSTESEIQDFRLWSLKECGDVFVKSLTALRKRIDDQGADTILEWDKDDDVCLDFVAACSNLRSHCFHIPQKSRFDVKAIAGNIIPAIATTNAMVSGLVVLQLMKVLKGDLTRCRTSFINESYAATHKLISAGQLEKPSPLCLVCSTAANEVTIKVNVSSLSLKTLEEKILKEKLHMIKPDVVINDGSGKILISSDPEDMSADMYERSLFDFGLNTDSRLICEDYTQVFKIHLVILNDNDLSNQDFAIISQVGDLKPEEEKDSEAVNNDDDEKDNDLIVEDEPDIEIDCASPDSSDENGVEPPTKKMKTGKD